MLSIEKILEDCDDVSFRESFVRIGVFLSNKISKGGVNQTWILTNSKDL
jgi:hypothetical protein